MASNLDSSQIDTVLASIRQLEQGTTTTARNDDDDDYNNNYNNDGSKLNILRLAGPITGQSSRMDAHSPSTENAAENANGDTTQDLTPSMLEDDLAHYKVCISACAECNTMSASALIKYHVHPHPGTLLQAAILVRRTGHQGKISTWDCR